MIVTKSTSTTLKLDELTLRQKLSAFFQYATTYFIAFFGGLYAFWQFMPDDLKADLFSQFPAIAKYKTIVYLLSFAIGYYYVKMKPQTITVPEPKQPAPDEGPPTQRL